MTSSNADLAVLIIEASGLPLCAIVIPPACGIGMAALISGTLMGLRLQMSRARSHKLRSSQALRAFTTVAC